MEKILTIFVGKSLSIYTAKFYHGENSRWERVTITEFPLSFLKSIFKRRVIDVPILLNANGLEYEDFAEYNAINGEMAGEKIRIVFADLHLHENYAVMEKIPALSKSQGEITNLKLQLEALQTQYIDLCLAIEGLNEDLVKKKSIDLLKWIKEIRSRVGQTENPYSNNNEERY